MRVSWSKTALAQLKTIAISDVTSSTKKVANKIFNRTILLQNFPEMGSLQNFDSKDEIYKKHQYRYLVEGKYKILYYISKNDIRISLVFHTNQEPEKLFLFLRKEN